MLLRQDIKYYIRNGKMEPISTFPFYLFDNYISVYEVINIKYGKSSFQDHSERMHDSLLMAFPDFTIENFINWSEIQQFIHENNVVIGNIRFDIFPQQNVYLVFFIPHHYPDFQQYKKGVKLNFQHAERDMQNAKLYNLSLRESADKIIQKNKIFETLLVNRKGEITEGSRSNIFFIKNDIVFSPPDADILLGITRRNLINYLNANNIKFIKKAINLAELSYYESAFLTGTSLLALPCRQIENKKFDVENLLLKKIIKDFSGF
ncbi:MAG: hypothetical protein AUJ98_04310 [Bacteroidetes bacterium CG2_30_33_31]|nr:MAG: hypothetical protein AUJ98_04310 [Bacteroidetes bacterium CG2_30_33_31]